MAPAAYTRTVLRTVLPTVPRTVLRTGILAFCVVLFGAQAAMIADAHLRHDRRFGWQMFPETTRFRASLWRELADGSRVAAPHGRWVLETPEGRRQFLWRDQVRDWRLDDLDRMRQAKVSLDATLLYARAALDHVADRIPEDRETVRLHLVVEWEKADGTRGTTELASKRRIHAGDSAP